MYADFWEYVQVEALVERLKLPVKVVYLGAEKHREAIWRAYTQRVGALFYSFYPNTNQHGISGKRVTKEGILFL